MSASSSHKVLLVADEQIARYGFGDSHPFGPDRYGAFMEELRRSGVEYQTERSDSRLATREELEAFHTARYIDFVAERCAMGHGYLDGGDTPAWRGLFEVASHVVGATLTAVDALMQGEARHAFIPIAGLHHAARDRAAGFCVFNDCGIAIEILRRRYGLKRIAYIDIDAHHGDGVFYGFEADPELAFVDLHEDGHFLYPGTGAASETGKGAAKGTKLNIPMPPGSDDAAFMQTWPRVEEYLIEREPEFLILQCGADSLAGDPITHLQYSEAAHAHAAQRLCALAKDFGHGRVIATGGGGYNRRNLARAWTRVVQAMVESQS